MAYGLFAGTEYEWRVKSICIVTITVADTKGSMLKIIADEDFLQGNHKLNFSELLAYHTAR